MLLLLLFLSIHEITRYDTRFANQLVIWQFEGACSSPNTARAGLYVNILHVLRYNGKARSRLITFPTQQHPCITVPSYLLADAALPPLGTSLYGYFNSSSLRM